MAQASLIQLIRCHAWGDVLMATAVLPGLKAQGYRIRVVTCAPFDQALQHHPLIDELLTVPRIKLGNPWRKQRLLRDVSSRTRDRQRVERTVFLDNAPNLTRLRAAILDTWPHGVSQYWIPKTHQLAHFCRLARVPLADTLFLALSETELAWGQAFESAVLIHPFSSNARKDWPLNRWEALVRLIQRDHGLTVYQLGSTKQTTLIPGARPLGNPDMRHAMAAVSHCRLLVASDSVFNHVSRAARRPAVILFGPTHPHVFGYAQNINLWHGHVWTPALGALSETEQLQDVSSGLSQRRLQSEESAKETYRRAPIDNAALAEGINPAMAANTLDTVYGFVHDLLKTAVPTAASDTRPGTVTKS